MYLLLNLLLDSHTAELQSERGHTVSSCVKSSAALLFHSFVLIPIMFCSSIYSILYLVWGFPEVFNASLHSE